MKRKFKYIFFWYIHAFLTSRTFHLCIIYYSICGTDVVEARVIKLNLKLNFGLYWKEKKFIGFNAVVLVETFPLMQQLLL